MDVWSSKMRSLLIAVSMCALTLAGCKQSLRVGESMAVLLDAHIDRQQVERLEKVLADGEWRSSTTHSDSPSPTDDLAPQRSQFMVHPAIAGGFGIVDDLDESEELVTGDADSESSEQAGGASDLVNQFSTPDALADRDRARRQRRGPQGMAQRVPFWQLVSEQRVEPEVTRTLQLLMKRDDLIGWNAAILLGLRPASDKYHLVESLEPLVTNPPSYDPKTLQRASGRAKESTIASSVSTRLASVFSGSKPKAKPVAKPLRKMLKVASLPIAMRTAAAAAWCHCSSVGGDPEENFAAVGELLASKNSLPDSVRAELLRGVAGSIRPRVIPRLAELLDVKPGGRRSRTTLRRAAMEACMIHAMHSDNFTTSHTSEDASNWPDTIRNGRTDPDFKVRMLYGRWLAYAMPNVAAHELEQLLQDRDARVQHSAMVSLSLVKSPRALDILRTEVSQAGDRERADIVRLLAVWGENELAPLAADKSVAVRVAVAESLPSPSRLRDTALSRKLLADESPQVQLAVVQRTGDWEIDRAATVLLHAMLVGESSTRAAATERLSTRLNAKVRFDAEWPLRLRRWGVEDIAKKFGLTLLDSSKGPVGTLHIRENVELLGMLREFVTTPTDKLGDIVDALKKYPSDALTTIEQFMLAPISENGTVLPISIEAENILFRKVLPSMSPMYAALYDIESTENVTKYQGLQRLEQTATALPLSRLLIRRLTNNVVASQNVTIWHRVLLMLMTNDSPEAAHLAYHALDQRWPDTRILGCRYLSQHAAPEHAARIFRAEILGYAEPTVQIEAIRAVGYCGNPLVLSDGHPAAPRQRRLLGLRTILTSPNLSLRIEAAVAMSRLADGQGADELIRLSNDSDNPTQLAAVRAMGSEFSSEIIRNRFIGRLIQVGWSDSKTETKRAVVQSLRQLVPPALQPWVKDDGRATTTRGIDDQIAAWASWWKQRGDVSTGDRAGD